MATTKDFALSFVLFSFSEPKSERDDDIHVHVVTMLRQMREKDECDLTVSVPATLPPGQASSQSTSKYDSVPGPLSPLRVVNVYFDVNATNLPFRFKSTCRYVSPQLPRDDVNSLVMTSIRSC